MTRLVIVVTVNRIDDLLLAYGGEYQLEAEAIKEYLAKHEKPLESESIRHVVKAIEDQKLGEYEKTHAPSLKDMINEKERGLDLDY